MPDEGRRSNQRRDSDVSVALLQQMVKQNHEQLEEGHQRLRESLRDVQQYAEDIDGRQSILNVRITAAENVAKLPMNMEKVTFSTKQLLAIIAACGVMAGSMWRLQSSSASTAIAINELRATIATSDKLQDARNETQKAAMDQLRAGLEQRRVEIQRVSDSLGDFIRTQGRQGR